MRTNNADTHRQIDEWFDTHTNEMIADLARLVAIRSVKGEEAPGKPYGEGPSDALALCARLLDARGLSVASFENRVITADLNARPPELGILAHVDIVPEGEGWQTDPYTLTQRDGLLIGRGTSDDKGPAVAAMYAMHCARELTPNMPRGARLILGSDEESGYGDFTLYRQANALPPYLFTPDANFPVVNTEKGRYLQQFSASWEEERALPRVVSVRGGATVNMVPGFAQAVIEGIALDEARRMCRVYSEKTGAALSADENGGAVTVSAEGVPAHAAMPQLGCNAQTALIAMLADMPLAAGAGAACIRGLNRIFPHGDGAGEAIGLGLSDELSGGLTLNFGVLDYTLTGLTGSFDSRTPRAADERDILGIACAALCGAGLAPGAHSLTKCHHTPPDSPLVKTLLEIYSLYTGERAEAQMMGGSTYVHGVPGGVAFGCEFPGTDNRIHSAGEFIGVRQLVLSAKMFTRAILEMCG